MNKGKYILNTTTHCLHIEGYCKKASPLPYHVKYFESEDEALAFGGRSVWLCSNCKKEREKRTK